MIWADYFLALVFSLSSSTFLFRHYKTQNTLFELVQRAETRAPKCLFTRAPKLGDVGLIPGLLHHDHGGQPWFSGRGRGILVIWFLAFGTLVLTLGLTLLPIVLSFGKYKPTGNYYLELDLRWNSMFSQDLNKGLVRYSDGRQSNGWNFFASYSV